MKWNEQFASTNPLFVTKQYFNYKVTIYGCYLWAMVGAAAESNYYIYSHTLKGEI